MIRQKLTAFLTAGMLLSCIASTPVSAAPEKNNGMRNMSTMELVRDMGIGINLGNTLEACGDWIAQWGDGTPSAYETAWGSPVITQQMIEGMAGRRDRPCADHMVRAHGSEYLRN